jgi:hypothetical protein
VDAHPQARPGGKDARPLKRYPESSATLAKRYDQAQAYCDEVESSVGNATYIKVLKYVGLGLAAAGSAGGTAGGIGYLAQGSGTTMMPTDRDTTGTLGVVGSVVGAIGAGLYAWAATRMESGHTATVQLDSMKALAGSSGNHAAMVPPPTNPSDPLLKGPNDIVDQCWAIATRPRPARAPPSRG